MSIYKTLKRQSRLEKEFMLAMILLALLKSEFVFHCKWSQYALFRYRCTVDGSLTCSQSNGETPCKQTSYWDVIKNMTFHILVPTQVIHAHMKSVSPAMSLPHICVTSFYHELDQNLFSTSITVTVFCFLHSVGRTMEVTPVKTLPVSGRQMGGADPDKYGDCRDVKAAIFATTASSTITTLL